MVAAGLDGSLKGLPPPERGRGRSMIVVAAGAFLLSGIAPAPAALAPGTGVSDPALFYGSICGQQRKRMGPPAALQRLAMAQANAATDDRIAPAPVPLIEGLTGIGMTVSTVSPAAQRYFNQGLALAYGFNQDGAIRAFRAAQALDPLCAMCFWGEAYALGANINVPMDPAAAGRARAAVRRAMALGARATAAERALINALAARYDPEGERPALDRAYAVAMQRAAAAFPRNDEIAVLAAEAIMNTQPWDYWEADSRTPKGEAGDAIAAIERVLARNPDHPQAIHLYIHLLEASAMPERAEAAADRLARATVAGAGHLVHMPSHIYQRLGRHSDSIASNVAAARADEAWLASTNDHGIYRYGYYPHNVHFIVTSAQMGGDKALALDQTARLRSILGVEVAMHLPWVQLIHAAPSFVHAQFGKPDEILAQPAPDARLPYAVAMWSYARAVAHARGGETAGVLAEISAMRRLRDTADFQPMIDGGVPAPDLIELAEHVALGRLAYAQRRFADAVGHYERAIALEDRLPYMEASLWYFPVRQSLGSTSGHGPARRRRAAFPGSAGTHT
jgi:tetratricopeptide (TPR) repeat protein